MKICFFGSEDFSIPTLKALIEAGHDVVAVVTRADKKKGRGLEETSTAVADFAEKAGIQVYKPETFKDGEFCLDLNSIAPEINVVCAYGKILNTGILCCPLKGCINVHPSMLPKYRGATPIESALKSGDKMTGVSIFYMDEGCDTGDIIIQREFPIEESDNRGTLREKLSVFAAGILIEAVDEIQSGSVKRTVQSKDGVCCTSLIKKEDLFINWNIPSRDIINFVRSVSPLPAARTFFRGKQLQVSALDIFETDKKGEAGRIVDIVKNIGPIIATADGTVRMFDVKMEGKKFMSSWSFACGVNPKPGEAFEI